MNDDDMKLKDSNVPVINDNLNDKEWREITNVEAFSAILDPNVNQDAEDYDNSVWVGDYRQDDGSVYSAHTRFNVYYLSTMDLTSSDVGALVKNNLTEFDRAVVGALTTLYLAKDSPLVRIVKINDQNYRSVSARDVRRVMSGDLTDCEVTKKQIAEIDRSINKLNFIAMHIDLTEHAKMKGLDTKIFKISGALVSTMRVQTSEDIRYVINQVPLLYIYANAVDQVLQIPMELLRIGGSDTKRNASIRFYILRRVLSKNQNCRILFDSVLEAINNGQPENNKLEPTKMNMLRLREFVMRCFEDLIQCGYVASYTVGKEGKAYRYIDFVPGERNPRRISKK